MIQVYVFALVCSDTRGTHESQGAINVDEDTMYVRKKTSAVEGVGIADAIVSANEIRRAQNTGARLDVEGEARQDAQGFSAQSNAQCTEQCTEQCNAQCNGQCSGEQWTSCAAVGNVVPEACSSDAAPIHKKFRCWMGVCKMCNLWCDADTQGGRCSQHSGRACNITEECCMPDEEECTPVPACCSGDLLTFDPAVAPAIPQGPEVFNTRWCQTISFWGIGDEMEIATGKDTGTLVRERCGGPPPDYNSIPKFQCSGTHGLNCFQCGWNQNADGIDGADGITSKCEPLTACTRCW